VHTNEQITHRVTFWQCKCYRNDDSLHSAQKYSSGRSSRACCRTFICTFPLTEFMESKKNCCYGLRRTWKNEDTFPPKVFIDELRKYRNLSTDLAVSAEIFRLRFIVST